MYARKFGATVLEGYGATECSPVVSVNQPQANHPGTVGTLLPGVEVRLYPVPGLTEGAVVHIRGPNVMKGYLSPERPGRVEPPPDGWFDTGDLATLDAYGYLTITGRLKRFARIGAEMVSLTAVETHAQTLWPEARHAAVSVGGARGREQIILLTEQRDAELDAFRAWRDEHGVAPIETPRRVFVVPEIPILATGKVDYATAQRMAEMRCEPDGSNANEPAAHT
jgi:acyl-[acyl-carrier-protein]-phospholipid O-acyltransferase/long-chain-fatty-acid--[acyl-carrier-protein] ligase